MPPSAFSRQDHHDRQRLTIFLACTTWLLLLGAGPAQAKTGDDNPALHQAVRTNDMTRLKQLLAAENTIDEADRLGNTALHLAAAANPYASRLLIQAGAGLDRRNAGGITALMVAAGTGQSSVVQWLIDAGARVDFRDYQGNSARDWAQNNGHLALAKQLTALEAGSLSENGRTEDPFAFDEDVFVDVQLPDWFETDFLDLQAGLEEARAAGKRGLMVFISTRRCSYCKTFIQRSLERADIRQRVQQDYRVFGLEIFDDTEMTDPNGTVYRVKAFVKAHQASFTPTLIFYDLQGKQRLKIVGYYPAEDFNSVLDYLEQRQDPQQTLRAYLNSKRSSMDNHPRPVITEQGLFSAPPFLLDRRTGPAATPLLVIFEQPNCDACERFHHRVLADPSIRTLLGGYELVQLDVTSPTPLLTPTGQRLTAAQWYSQLKLGYYPAILFFSETGREVLRLDSETLRFRMEGSLQMVLEKGYLDEAQLQKWRRQKAVQAFAQRGDRPSPPSLSPETTSKPTN